MSILKKIVALVKGSGVVAWAKGELNKSIARAADKVAAKYGDAAKQLVLDAVGFIDPATGITATGSVKLFKVAADLGALVAADGPTAPFGVLVIVAQQAFEQTKADALTEVNAFLDTVR